MNKILENIFFVSTEPVTLAQLSETLQFESEAGIKGLKEAIKKLKVKYEKRGLRLIELGGGYLLTTQPQYDLWIRRYTCGTQIQLTEEGKVTLAIIAYKQPIKKSEIEAIRGVDCESVLQTLRQCGLIHVVGDVIGSYLFCTTRRFLKQLNLNALSDLPKVGKIGL